MARLHPLESKAQSRDREGAVNERQLRRTTLDPSGVAVRFVQQVPCSILGHGVGSFRVEFTRDVSRAWRSTMPLDPFRDAPRQISQLLSRRGMLQAGLLPLLALRGSAGERILDGDPRSALALQLEGGETGFHGMAISPDGSTAYVAFRTPDVVLVVDLRAGRLRSAIDLTPAGPMTASDQAVLSADGKLLFVANQGIGNMAVIDTATERVIKVLPFCPGLGDSIKASPAGKVYIGLLDGRLVTCVLQRSVLHDRRMFGVSFNSIALSAQRRQSPLRREVSPGRAGLVPRL